MFFIPKDKFINSIIDTFGSLEEAYENVKFIFLELSKTQQVLKRLIRTKKQYLVIDRFQDLYEYLKSSDIGLFYYCGNITYNGKVDYTRHIQAFVDNNSYVITCYHNFYLFLRKYHREAYGALHIVNNKIPVGDGWNDYILIGKMYTNSMIPFYNPHNISQLNTGEKKEFIKKLKKQLVEIRNIARGTK